MMGRLNHDQAQLFYSFSLEKIVPEDHLEQIPFEFTHNPRA